MSDRKLMDCGDNSCQFEGRDRGGMRTNGGCYCLEDLDFDKRMRALGYIRHLEAEVERLRCIISPGDAAAFEEHMATREAHWVAQVERLREEIERVRGWAFEHGYDGLEEQLRAALRGGGE